MWKLVHTHSEPAAAVFKSPFKLEKSEGVADASGEQKLILEMKFKKKNAKDWNQRSDALL